MSFRFVNAICHIFRNVVETQAPDVMMVGAGETLLFYSGTTIQANTPKSITVPLVSNAVQEYASQLASWFHF